MRLVPLIAAVFLCTSTFAEDVVVKAGKNWMAVRAQNDGLKYEDKGDFVNARIKFDEAIRLDSTMWPAYYNRASLNMRQHRLREALQDATIALRAKTSFSRSALLCALINAKMGNYDAAFRQVDQVISLGTRGDAYPHALNMSAWLHATSTQARYRDAQLAITQAAQSCQLTSYKKAGLVDTLAAAYAEAGDFDKAVQFERQAIALGDSPDFMRDYQEHLTSFQERRPWREHP